MAQHLFGHSRLARGVRVGAVVVVLALAGGVSAAHPQWFAPTGERVVSDPPPSGTPEADPAPERPTVRPAPVVPRRTLGPAPEPDRRPDARKPAAPEQGPPRLPEGKLQRLRAAAEAELAPPVTTRPPRVSRPRGTIRPPVTSRPPVMFRMASFNVLGSSHTSRGGNKPGYAEGPTRIGWTADMLRASGVSVVGFQEYEPNQHRAFARRTGGSWGVFPGLSQGRRGVRNSVAWRSATWQLVRAHTIPIPYFRGKPVPMPYVLLEHRRSGERAWFISIHNPTSNAKRGNNQRWRNVATQRERNLLVDLHSSGTPVFLTGDFNERDEAYCRVTAGGVAQAAQGGRGGRPCRPPATMGIDWIFGTPDVTFRAYVRRQDAAVRRTSDHPMILTTATLPR